MRTVWITATLLLLALGPARATLAQWETSERPVRGEITLVHPEARTIGVGPMTFFVPAGVLDLDEVEEGSYATVRFDRRGDTLVARSVELETDAE